MLAMDDPRIPTARLDIEWPAGTPFTDETEEAFNAAALEQITAKAAELIVAGQRPAFEVWYHGVPGRPDTTAENFDAVEVAEDGTVTTLPSYALIRGEV